MIFFGIDPGFDRCGVAAIEYGDALWYKTIQTDPDQSFGERLNNIENSIDDLVSMYSPGDVAIGIEIPIFFGRNTNAGKVQQVIGVILCCLAKNGHDYTELSPSHVKATVWGGKATKAQVKRGVARILSIDSFKGVKDDAIDALAIAITLQMDLLKKTAA